MAIMEEDINGLNKMNKLKCLTGSFFLADIARTTVSSKPLANVSDSIRVVKPGLYSLHTKEAVTTSWGVSVTALFRIKESSEALQHQQDNKITNAREGLCTSELTNKAHKLMQNNGTC